MERGKTQGKVKEQKEKKQHTSYPQDFSIDVYQFQAVVGIFWTLHYCLRQVVDRVGDGSSIAGRASNHSTESIAI